jgi:hypothetical protein
MCNKSPKAGGLIRIHIRLMGILTRTQQGKIENCDVQQKSEGGSFTVDNFKLLTYCSCKY